MVSGDDEAHERRSYHRVAYPPQKRGQLAVGSYAFDVIDISKQGIRFLNPGKVKLSEWIGATITLQDGSSLAVEGKIVWTDDHLLGMQLLNPIPYNHILNEQCYLIQEGRTKHPAEKPKAAEPPKKDLRIYVVRQGGPVYSDRIPDTPLSENARADVEKIGMFLKQRGFTVGFLFHGGRSGAAETAELLGSLITVQDIRKKEGMSRNDPVEPFLSEIIDAREDMMVVGQVPFLVRLVKMLIGAGNDQEPIAMQPGAIVCLQRKEDNTWSVEWMLAPELFRKQGAGPGRR